MFLNSFMRKNKFSNETSRNGHFLYSTQLLLLTHLFPRSYLVVSGVLLGRRTVLKTGNKIYLSLG